jgi:hypothetical protein
MLEGGPAGRATLTPLDAYKLAGESEPDRAH